MSRAAVPSVRRRLLVNLLVGFVLCWLSVAALTYHLSLKQVNRLFDDDMVDFGEAALRLLDLATEDQAGEDGSITEIIERSREAIQGLPLLRRESALGYALWRDGQPLLSSPQPAAGDHGPGPRLQHRGSPGHPLAGAPAEYRRLPDLDQRNLIYRQHTMNLLLFYLAVPTAAGAAVARRPGLVRRCPRPGAATRSAGRGPAALRATPAADRGGSGAAGDPRPHRRTQPPAGASAHRPRGRTPTDQRRRP